MAPENTDFILGSTITPTTTVTPKVSTLEIDTNSLSIDGVEVNGITHSIDVVDSTKKLPSAYAIESAVQDIERDMSDLQNEFDGIYFSPVLSDPIIDPFFVDPNWQLFGFERDFSNVVFTRQTLAEGSLRIRSDAFKNPGLHFIYLELAELPRGTLSIINQADTILKVCTLPGVYALEVTIAQPTVDYIDFVVAGLNVNESCRINAIYVHWVKTAFGRYMDYMAGKLLSGGSGFASEAFVNTVASQTLMSANDYTNDVVVAIGGDIQTHLSATNNPHGVSYNQTGAAPLVHGHTPDSINAADKIHTHVPTECGAAPLIHTHTPTETGAAPLVHTHIPTECGAAPVVHTHTPNECESAPTVHPHVLSDITDIGNIYDELSALDTRITSIDIGDEVQEHLSNLNNPHGTTKAQVGLGDVVNAPMATDQEALDGVLEDRYMNPRNSKLVLSDILNTPDLEPTKLVPTPIRTIVWNNSQEEITIPIYPDRLYKLAIKSKDHLSLKAVRLIINDILSPDDDIRNNINMAKTLTIGTDTVSVMGWDQSNNKYFKLMLPALGINGGVGELTLNTNAMTLTGIMHGYVFDPTTGIELQDKSYPYTVSSAYAPNTAPVPSELILSPEPGMFLNMEIVIYELLQPTQEPVMVVDATPVGTMVSRYGTSTVPGWALTDGSELLRSMYPELWALAQNTNMIIPNGDWNAAITADGFTPYFSDGDGVTTFRLPKELSVVTDLKHTYIKTKYTQVPSGDEILYRFIWEN